MDQTQHEDGDVTLSVTVGIDVPRGTPEGTIVTEFELRRELSVSSLRDSY